MIAQRLLPTLPSYRGTGPPDPGQTFAGVRGHRLCASSDSRGRAVARRRPASTPFPGSAPASRGDRAFARHDVERQAGPSRQFGYFPAPPYWRESRPSIARAGGPPNPGTFVTLRKFGIAGVEPSCAGEGPASTPFPGSALQVVDTGPSPGMTWRGKQVPPDDSVISQRLLTGERAGPRSPRQRRAMPG